MKIEGSILEVCEDCLKYGERIIEPEEITLTKSKKKVSLPEEEILVDNYGKLISEKRKELKLTREEFAKKIKEKESVIRRVESEEMIPDDKLIKKIENFLEIKLRRKFEEKPLKRKEIKQKLTLGDVVELKE